MSSDPSASRDRSSRVSSPFSPRSLVAVIKILAVHNRCLSPYNNEKLQSRESSLARKLSRTLYTHSQRKYNISVYLPIYPQTINLGRRGRQDRGDETAVSSWTLAAAGAAAAYFRPSTARRDSSALRVSFSSASSSSSSSSFSIAPSLSLSLLATVRARNLPSWTLLSLWSRARACERDQLSFSLSSPLFLPLSLSPLPFLPLPRRRRSRRRRSHRQRRRARAPSFSLSRAREFSPHLRRRARPVFARSAGELLARSLFLFLSSSKWAAAAAAPLRSGLPHQRVRAPRSTLHTPPPPRAERGTASSSSESSANDEAAVSRSVSQRPPLSAHTPLLFSSPGFLSALLSPLADTTTHFLPL